MQSMARHYLDTNFSMFVVEKVLKFRHIIKHEGVLAELDLE